jgi:hypothetical protein
MTTSPRGCYSLNAAAQGRLHGPQGLISVYDGNIGLTAIHESQCSVVDFQADRDSLILAQPRRALLTALLPYDSQLWYLSREQ